MGKYYNFKHLVSLEKGKKGDVVSYMTYDKERNIVKDLRGGLFPEVSPASLPFIYMVKSGNVCFAKPVIEMYFIDGSYHKKYFDNVRQYTIAYKNICYAMNYNKFYCIDDVLSNKQFISEIDKLSVSRKVAEKRK